MAEARTRGSNTHARNCDASTGTLGPRPAPADWRSCPHGDTRAHPELADAGPAAERRESLTAAMGGSAPHYRAVTVAGRHVLSIAGSDAAVLTPGEAREAC